MKKLFTVPLLVLCAFLVLGATTIIKISSFPNTTTAANGDLFLLASGSTNKNISWAQLKQQIGTNPPTVTIVNVSITTNAFISYLTNINQYVTNQYVSFSYTTNLYTVNNFLQFITNNFLYTTNFYSDYATNSYLTVQNTFNVSGKATLNVVNTLSTTATNGFFVVTNAFSGPTNTVDLSVEDQGYQTFTPFSVTGVINKSNNVVQTVIMSFTNGASTNVLGTLASGIVIPQRTNQVALSNNSMATLTLRYHAKFGTNGVWVQF